MTSQIVSTTRYRFSSFFRLSILVALVSLVTQRSVDGDILYGLDSFNDVLFTLDTNTGAYHVVGKLPSFAIGGLAYDGSEYFYYTRWNSGIGQTFLYRIDPTDASTILIGPNGENYQGFEIIDGVGYGVGYGILYEVDLETGASTAIGEMDPDQTWVNFGLASHNKILYGYGSFIGEPFGQLAVIQPRSGEITCLNSKYQPIGNGPTGLVLAEDTLWGIWDFTLFQIDFDSGHLLPVITDLPIEWAAGLSVVSESVPGDINGDGIVGVVDLLLLFSAWGPCDGCDSCPADLDGDSVVSVLDLLALLSNWG